MVAVSEAPCDLQWFTIDDAMVERKIKPASCTYSNDECNAHIKQRKAVLTPKLNQVTFIMPSRK